MGLKSFLMQHNLPVPVMGGSVIHAKTELTARKKVLGKDGEYHYTGDDRRVKGKKVTTAFVDFIVDQLITETSAFGDFKWHEMGTGSTEENITDTALKTPTGIARSDGSQVETDHDTYKSVETITADATEDITEHGLFNAQSDGTLMDRTVFSAIGVVDGNQIEFTFEISFTAGN